MAEFSFAGFLDLTVDRQRRISIPKGFCRGLPDAAHGSMIINLYAYPSKHVFGIVFETADTSIPLYEAEELPKIFIKEDINLDANKILHMTHNTSINLPSDYHGDRARLTIPASLYDYIDRPKKVKIVGLNKAFYCLPQIKIGALKSQGLRRLD